MQQTSPSQEFDDAPLRYGFGKIFDEVKSEDVKGFLSQEDFNTFKRYCTHIDKFIDGEHSGTGIVIFGPPGTYKTSMLALLAKSVAWKYAQLESRLPLMQYVDAGKIESMLITERYQGGFEQPREHRGLRGWLERKEFLLIDDFGGTNLIKPDALAEWRMLINYRAVNQKTYCIATNIGLDEIAKQDAALADRLRMNIVIVIDDKKPSCRATSAKAMKFLHG